MDDLTLTVFLPNYNHARFLPETLSSLTEQSYQPLEVIIVDDASTDNSLEIIEEFAQSRPNVQVIKNETNRGVVASENGVIEMARGSHFYGLSADDRVRPGLLEKSMALLAEHPTAGFCSTLSYKIDESGTNLGLYPTPIVAERQAFFSASEAREILLQRGSWFMGNTTIYRRSALLECGDHVPELGPFYDGFMSQVMALRYGVCFIPEALGEFRQTAGQLSDATYDVRTAFPIYEHAIQLMRTTYRDLFPPEYVDRFECRTLAYTMERSLARSNAMHLGYLKTMLPRPRHRLLLSLVSLAMRCQFLLAKIWLIIAVRREFWPSLWRSIKQVVSFLLPFRSRKNQVEPTEVDDEVDSAGCQDSGMA